VSNLAQQPTQSVYRNDPRLSRLQGFLRDAHCLVQHLAPDFLEAADRHGLDWRLLPSISLVETGCGKTAVGNNIFGWDSGRRQFSSLREAIHLVASRLGQSKLYRGKGLNQLLATYNPRPHYAGLVRSVMNRLGPSDQAEARFVTEARLSQASSSPDIVRPGPLQ
jgi:hypothetical protein